MLRRQRDGLKLFGIQIGKQLGHEFSFTAVILTADVAQPASAVPAQSPVVHYYQWTSVAISTQALDSEF
jgi:hypothetical protein